MLHHKGLASKNTDVQETATGDNGQRGITKRNIRENFPFEKDMNLLTERIH